MKSLLSLLMSGVAVIAVAEAKPPVEKPMTIAEATSGPSKVAIWKTGDADTTVYMMGTVHILNPGIEWKNDTFQAAWDASSTVYFEADVTSPESLNEVAAMIPTYGLNKPGVTLGSFYTDEEKAKINDALSGFGINIDMLAPLRPWLAGVQVGQVAITSIGGSAEAGIEMILDGEANEAGKSKRYFETLTEQIEILAGGDDAKQAKVFLDGIEDLKSPEAFFSQMVGAWYSGNDMALDALLSDGFEDAPEIAEALLYKRNANWATALDTLIKEEEGVFFVAVGAGHLVGEKSVQDYLNEKGHASERLN